MCSRHDYEHLGETPAQTVVRMALARMATGTPADVLAGNNPAASLRDAEGRPPYWAVIHPSGSVTFAFAKPTYEDLNGAVQGYLEAVPHNRPEAGRLTAYCNEEGKLDGLPANLPATAFLAVDVSWDILVGPVVLIGGPDREGEDTALPADVLVALSASLR